MRCCFLLLIYFVLADLLINGAETIVCCVGLLSLFGKILLFPVIWCVGEGFCCFVLLDLLLLSVYVLVWVTCLWSFSCLLFLFTKLVVLDCGGVGC